MSSAKKSPQEKRIAKGRDEVTKQKKFVELVNKRMSRALRVIHNVGNLSAKSYSYTPEQAAKVVTALKRAVAEVEARFAKTEKGAAGGFDVSA